MKVSVLALQQEELVIFGIKMELVPETVRFHPSIHLYSFICLSSIIHLPSVFYLSTHSPIHPSIHSAIHHLLIHPPIHRPTHSFFASRDSWQEHIQCITPKQVLKNDKHLSSPPSGRRNQKAIKLLCTERRVRHSGGPMASILGSQLHHCTTLSKSLMYFQS